MNKWRTATKLAILALVAVAVVYDVIAYMRGSVDATISRVVLGWARSNPLIPFSVGVVCGHIFWSQPALSIKRDSEVGERKAPPTS
jgi:hypothetical protein